MTKIYQQTIEQGCQSGFSAVEVFGEDIEKYEYLFLPGEHTGHHAQEIGRITVRAFWETGDPVGFTLSKPDSDSVKKAFSTVYSSYLRGEGENYRRLLPSSAQKTRVAIFDESFREVDDHSFQELTDKIHEVMISPMFQRLKLDRIYLSRMLKKTTIANSNQLDIKYKKTIFTLQLGVTLGENCIDLSESRVFFSQIEPFKVISRAYNLLYSLAETPILAEPKQNVYFILSPEASAFILREFAQFFYRGGPEEVRNITYPSMLNIIDNPLMNNMTGSVPFDDEGVQSDEKFLVQKGVFNQTIASIEQSYRYGGQSTGNGFRNGRTPFPQVRFSNFYIKPTVLPLKNLFSDAGEGVYVSLLRLKDIDKDSYVFSGYGYRFKGNDMQEPVHIYIKTTFRSYFLKILKIAKEIKFFYSTANFGSPYILLEGRNRPGSIWEI